MDYRKHFMPGDLLIVKHSKYSGSRTGMVLIARAHEDLPYARFLVAVWAESVYVQTDWFHPDVLEPMPDRSLFTAQDAEEAAGGSLPIWLGSEVYSMTERAARGTQACLWTVCELRLHGWKRFVGPADRGISYCSHPGSIEAVLVSPGTDQHATASYANLAVSPASYAARKHRRKRPHLRHPESADPTLTLE